MATASPRLLLTTAVVAGPLITYSFPSTGLPCHPQALAVFTLCNPEFVLHLGIS
jgi:hypothetical protein